jgi:glycerol-3-phosphate dehydrogenase
MKMKNLPVYLSLALALTSLASCEKNIDEIAAPSANAAQQVQQTPQQLLVGGLWRMTDFTTTAKSAENGPTATVSLFGQLKSTQRDNQTQFTTAGGYILDEGATKMNEEMAQQKNGTYVLSEDAKTLTVKLLDSERVYSVEELTASTLRLKLTEGEGEAATSYTTTFAH